jgi:hypothetical protein
VIYSLLLTEAAPALTFQKIFGTKSAEIKPLSPCSSDHERERQKLVALSISMVEPTPLIVSHLLQIIELISIISTVIAINAIREEAIQQCRLEIAATFPDPVPPESSSSDSSSSISDTSTRKKSVLLSGLITAEKCIPKHPIDDEIKRRKVTYLLNLLKSPLFNR